MSTPRRDSQPGRPTWTAGANGDESDARSDDTSFADSPGVGTARSAELAALNRVWRDTLAAKEAEAREFFTLADEQRAQAERARMRAEEERATLVAALAAQQAAVRRWQGVARRALARIAVSERARDVATQAMAQTQRQHAAEEDETHHESSRTVISHDAAAQSGLLSSGWADMAAEAADAAESQEPPAQQVGALSDSAVRRRAEALLLTDPGLIVGWGIPHAASWWGWPLRRRRAS